MPSTPAYAAPAAGKPLAPFSVERRDPGPRDVEIDILFCGICHTDIHQVRDEWGGSTFPMVPGHEIVGRVRQVGKEVTRLDIGDLVGVGCMVDSCRACEPCRHGTEQFCEQGVAWTYGSTLMDRKTVTQGGYSSRIVVDQKFVLQVPAGLDPAGAAPLLCAGITTYSPLRQWGAKRGDRVGVVGLGGLGHMALKLAAAMGAEVTVLSTSRAKEADARRLGAAGFEVTGDDAAFRKMAGRLDLMIDTVSAPHDYNRYLGLLRPHGTMVLVGVPPEPAPVAAGALIGGNRRLAGSLIGGIAETQAMLDFCAQHRIVADVEVIPIQQVNQAYERMLKGDVRFRFAIDMASLKQG
ncbi:MAG: NAD(P)-dependent alcohol dehydrogenase [Deltaproteobacteria bacterium]|nr:NAD(P)-dependent alcohol dehydrogenase [Deltaproteobacteria bacterium]